MGQAATTVVWQTACGSDASASPLGASKVTGHHIRTPCHATEDNENLDMELAITHGHHRFGHSACESSPPIAVWISAAGYSSKLHDLGDPFVSAKCIHVVLCG